MANAVDALLALGRTGLLLACRGSILILAVLAVRAVFARTGLGRHNRLLWLAPLAALFVPGRLATGIDLPGLAALDSLPGPGAGTTVDPPVAGALAALFARPAETTATTPASSPPAAGAILAALWLAGALVGLAVIIIAQIRFARTIKDCRPVTRHTVLELFENPRRQAGVRRRLRLMESGSIATPCVWGVFRPVIILPRRLIDRLGPDGLECVLVHELEHVRRLDLPFQWAMALAAACHWWNPLVWVARRLFRADLESACDAAALARLGGSRARDYGGAILRLLAPGHSSPDSRCALGITDHFTDLKRRITMIASFKGKTSRWHLAGTAIIILLALAAGTADIRAESSLIPSPDGRVLFQPPLARTAVSLEYGWTDNPLTKKPFFHNGIDLKTPVGTAVLAAGDGRVTAAGEDPDYGTYLVVSHADGFATYYTKLGATLVTPDQTVKAGALIARSGNSGVTTGPHLHFTVVKDGRPVDPRAYIHF